MPRYRFYRFDPRVNFFHALACGARLEILKALKNEEKSVNEISELIQADKSVASRHLAILRQTGIVTARKEGLNVYYRIVNKKVIKIIDLATEILQEINRMRRDSLEL